MCTKPPQLSTVWLSSVEPQGKVWTSSRFSSSVLAQTCILAVYCLCTRRSQIVQCTRCSDKRFLSNTGIALTTVLYIRRVVSLKSYYKHYYQATMLVIVPEAICCCCFHGNGSDGRHMCSKYHGGLLCW